VVVASFYFLLPCCLLLSLHLPFICSVLLCLFFSSGGVVGSRWRHCCNCQWFQTVVLPLSLFLGGFLFFSIFASSVFYDGGAVVNGNVAGVSSSK